ncbi:hypothetical protein [Nostoc sp.]|uniref:hypothetical protein n=1 Tax=Nostoc sp. TaxID=1180 RepID=UPI002FFC8386
MRYAVANTSYGYFQKSNRIPIVKFLFLCVLLYETLRLCGSLKMRNEPQRRKGHKERKFGAASQSNDINPSVLI